jgi:hypothetical protein
MAPVVCTAAGWFDIPGYAPRFVGLTGAIILKIPPFCGCSAAGVVAVVVGVVAGLVVVAGCVVAGVVLEQPTQNREHIMIIAKKSNTNFFIFTLLLPDIIEIVKIA